VLNEQPQIERRILSGNGIGYPYRRNILSNSGPFLASMLSVFLSSNADRAD
jgi:hypothetical protein